jgi:hypothetical protein
MMVCAALTFGFGMAAHADASKSTATANSCRDFVQRFYNWYLSPAKSSDVALKQKSSMFTPELKQKLEEDEKASAKSPGEIVGLDFDPFLNAQDDPGHMVAEKATMKGANCFVEVHRSPRDPREGKKPDVMPELTFKNGQWVFVNFHYPMNTNPGDGDLLSVLKGLAADRAKH